MDMIALGETLMNAILVLPDSLCEIAGHTNVQNTIKFIREYVYCRFFHHYLLQI
jgi:hypothetical protein